MKQGDLTPEALKAAVEESKTMTQESLTTRDLAVAARAESATVERLQQRLAMGLISAAMGGKNGDYCNGFMDAGDLVFDMFELTPDDMAGLPAETVEYLKEAKSARKGKAA